MTLPLAKCPRCASGQECQRGYRGQRGGWRRCINWKRAQSRAHARMLIGQLDAIVANHEARKQSLAAKEKA